MKRAWFRFAVAAALVASCTVPALDLADKECPCTTGYVCDTTTNVCFTTGRRDAEDAGDSAAPGVDAAVARDPCASDAGPPLVPVGNAGLCIDSVEVSVGNYRAFLAARAGDTSGQRADCKDNDDLIPMGGLPLSSEDDKPIRYVDFCDALAFCDWAGKRLCGPIDAGTRAFLDAGTDPDVSEWYRACSRNHDGTHDYPYGQTFDQAKCNSFSDAAARDLRAVGATKSCVGGYDGIYDLSGNVDEWEDLCETSDAGRTCSTRGGDWNNFYSFASACASVRPNPPTATASTLGFRCCSR